MRQQPNHFPLLPTDAQEDNPNNLGRYRRQQPATDRLPQQECLPLQKSWERPRILLRYQHASVSLQCWQQRSKDFQLRHRDTHCRHQQPAGTVAQEILQHRESLFGKSEAKAFPTSSLAPARPTRSKKEKGVRLCDQIGRVGYRKWNMLQIHLRHPAST